MASGFRKRDAAGWAVVMAGLIVTGMLAPAARGQGTQEKIYLAYPATPGKAPPPAYMIVITYPKGVTPSSTEGLPAGSRIQGNKILLPAGQALPTTFTLGLGVATEVPAFVQFPETVTPPAPPGGTGLGPVPPVGDPSLARPPRVSCRVRLHLRCHRPPVESLLVEERLRVHRPGPRGGRCSLRCLRTCLPKTAPSTRTP